MGSIWHDHILVLIYLPIYIAAILEGEIYYITICVAAAAGKVAWEGVLVSGALVFFFKQKTAYDIVALPGATNVANIRGALLYPYNTSVDIYRCTGDRDLVAGADLPRVRNYSLNG